MDSLLEHRGVPAADPGRVAQHFAQTAWIAAPIAFAQLAQMGMGLTDTIMLGGVSNAALAAGGLGANIFFTFMFVLQGLLSGVGVLAARAHGAGREGDMPAIYWTGVVLACALTLPMFALMSAPQGFLRLVGEPAALIRDVATYLHVLRWGVPAALVGIGMMRVFLPAARLERLLLWVMPGAVLLNAALNWVLIRGAFGLPGYGLQGSAAATATSLWVIAIFALGLLHGRPSWRHFVGPARPVASVLRELLAIGMPVSLTMVVEGALFLATGFLIGVLGQTVLAAHMVALSVASVSFMVPLAISQAANVRVASACGAGNPSAARRAGQCAIALGAGFMGCAALVLMAVPNAIAGIYLGPITPQNAATAAIAVSLLRIAALFQVADGTQVVAAGALRGLADTRVPMLLAAFGYWGIGFWAGRTLAFDRGLGAVGLWWGLFAGLAATATGLTLRFIIKSRVTA